MRIDQMSALIKNFSVVERTPLLEALKKIDKNKSGSIFVTDENQAVIGVVTDGDIRRSLIQNLDLNVPVEACMNRQFFWLPDGVEDSYARQMLSARVQVIPMLNSRMQLSNIVTPQSAANYELNLDGKIISETSPCFVIAEIGNNHNGSLEKAKKLIDLAAEMEVDCVKFQMRKMNAVYREASLKGTGDLATEYTLDLLKKYNLSLEQHTELAQYTKAKGLIYLCTPWDIESAQALLKIGVSAFKVASADLTNYFLIEFLAQTKKPLLISTGMSTENEIQQSLAFLHQHEAQWALLHCNSTYPAPAHSINLNYMKRLRELHPLVGYSGHERGIQISIAAAALGAKVIERHFTLDRTMEGPDHAASLEPKEFSELVKGVREVELALGSSVPRRLSQGEMMNRDNLGKSLIAKKSLPIGHVITKADVEVKSPGQGLSPLYMNQLVGVKLTRPMNREDFFYTSDIKGEITEPVAYSFENLFGVPVRFHDYQDFLKKVPMSLLEFHLSYRDLEIKIEDHLKLNSSIEFVVHAPELFADSHILDLASENEEYRQQSIVEMKRVIDLTIRLTKYFPKTKRPRIVTNVGGWSIDSFKTRLQKETAYKILKRSLDELYSDKVEIIPQSMPPFPWHMGGQRFHNLFVEASEISKYCKKWNLRICLDISHSKLAANFKNENFEKFLDQTLEFTTHIHLADAAGLDSEGLPLGEGELDLPETLNRIADHPEISFIPEIWQGHKNGGEGFWEALNRAEKLSSGRSRLYQRKKEAS